MTFKRLNNKIVLNEKYYNIDVMCITMTNKIKNIVRSTLGESKSNSKLYKKSWW